LNRERKQLSAGRRNCLSAAGDYSWSFVSQDGALVWKACSVSWHRADNFKEQVNTKKTFLYKTQGFAANAGGN